MNAEQEFYCPDEYIGSRIDIALAAIMPDISRSKISTWLKSGQILVNQQQVKANTKLQGTEYISIAAHTEDVLHIEPQDIPIDVIYQDTDIIVINKPAGLVTHPGNGNFNNTLLNAIVYHFPHQANLPRAGLVHRLDKDTSGLLVIASNMLAQEHLMNQLQSHTVSRIYHAIVAGHPPQQGSFTQNIGRDTYHRTKMAAIENGGKEAITNYQVLQYFSCCTYLQCSLHTGRTYQIRVHLSSAGFAILGDQTYKPTRLQQARYQQLVSSPVNRQLLHAKELSLLHPTQRQLVHFRTDLAGDFSQFLEAMQIIQNNLQNNY
jgi:23S rRNA pseudouridine1911/1915/1917 synthase